jgi:Restriction endonuclease BamHI
VLPTVSLVGNTLKMRIVEEVVLFDQLTEADAIAAGDADLAEVRAVIPTIHWPPGTGRFTINPTPMGNGVVPIKEAFAFDLHARGWQMEVLAFGRGGPGEFDAGRLRDGAWSTFVEWETGNISSSHRSLNRLLLALKRGIALQGVLTLSDGLLYPYLTDRVGNWRELSIYRDVYARTDVPGRLVVVVVGYDATDPSVPLIGKGTDGHALR